MRESHKLLNSAAPAVITPTWTWGSAKDTPAFASRAVAVLGVTRSGTSAIAGALLRLGVRMCGDIRTSGLNPTGTYEDRDFLEIGLQHRSKENEKATMTMREGRAYASRIRARNKKYALWGVKEPRMMFVMRSVVKLFESLRIIVVQRSMSAVFASNEATEKKLQAPSLDAQYATMTVILAAMGVLYPTCFIYFESLLEQPEHVIGKLADFAFDGLGFSPAPEDIQAAVDFIDPSLPRFGREGE